MVVVVMEVHRGRVGTGIKNRVDAMYLDSCQRPEQPRPAPKRPHDTQVYHDCDEEVGDRQRIVCSVWLGPDL